MKISIYGICISVSILLGIMLWIELAKFYKIKRDDILHCSIYTIIGSAIGAKILFFITNMKNIINEIIINPKNIINLLTGGFVFYGGIIGGTIAIYIYSKKFNINFKKLILSIVPAISLMHAIGRIGCLFVGCCYGISYEGIWNIKYTNSIYAPNNIQLFPVQLIESQLNSVILIILLITYKKWLHTYKTIGLYCVLYGTLRFILEFFRGDEIRGIILGLSTSQWISLVLIGIGILLFIIKVNKKGRI